MHRRAHQQQADALTRAPEQVQRGADAAQHGQRHVVALQSGGHGWERVALHAQTLEAAGPGREVQQHLRQRERQRHRHHREVDARQPARRPGEGRRQHRADQRRDRQAGQHRPVQVPLQQRRGVRAGRDEHAMPERHLARVAHQKADRQHRDRVGEAHAERIGPEAAHERGRDQQHEQRQHVGGALPRELARGFVGHASRLRGGCARQREGCGVRHG